MRLEDIVDLRQQGFRETRWLEVNFDTDAARVRRFNESDNEQSDFETIEPQPSEEPPEPEPVEPKCLECDQTLAGRQSRYCSIRCGNRARKREWRRWLKSLEPGKEELIAPVVEESDLAAKAERERLRQANLKREYLQHVPGGFKASGYLANSEAVDSLHATETAPRFWARQKVSTATPAIEPDVAAPEEDTVFRLCVVDEETGNLLEDVTLSESGCVPSSWHSERPVALSKLEAATSSLE